MEKKFLQIVLKENGQAIGWLRYGLFWDIIPYKRKGLGKQLVFFWESEMRKCGHKLVMTSSQSNEEGQHFYGELEYKDAGSLLVPKEPLEIIFIKYL